MSERLPTGDYPQDPLFHWGEYNFYENIARPKHESSVFMAARELQAELSTKTSESIQEIMHEATHAVGLLNAALIEQDLHGERVIIEGTDIAVTRTLMYEEKNGILLTATPHEDEPTDDFIEMMGATRQQGTLRCFGQTIEAVDTPAGAKAYQAKICYIVACDSYLTPFAGVEPYARGEIDKVHLEYVEDYTRRIASEAYETIRLLGSEYINGILNELCLVLTRSERDAAAIRRIGELSQELCQAPVMTPAGRDAIIDLISAYIDRQYEYDLASSHAYVRDAEGQMSDVVYQEDATIEVSDEIKMITFWPEMRNKEDDPEHVEEMDHQTLFFVTEQDTRTYLISFKDVHRFGIATA